MTTSVSDDPSLANIIELASAGHLTEAHAAAQHAVGQDEVSDAVLGMAGMLAWKVGNPAAAVAPLRALLKRRPNDRATRLNLASALAQVGTFDEIDELLASLNSDPGVDRLRAFAAQQTGNLEGAAELYLKVVHAAPRDADSWNNLGNVHAALDAVDQAIKAFEHAITLRPNDPRIYLNLAQVLERADRTEPRLRVVRDAVSQAPDNADVQLALGLAEAASNDMGRAEAAFERAIALAPESPAAYLELGLLLENRNRLEELDELVARADRSLAGPEAALLAGWAALRANRLDKAAALARTIPEDTINPIRRLHLHAQIADRQGDPAEAFKLFSEMNRASIAAAPLRHGGPTYREKIISSTEAFRDGDRIATSSDRSGTAAPTFVVGFPRSGTTLVDVLLGSVPDTCVLEEQPVIASIEGRLAAEPGLGVSTDVTDDVLRRHYFEKVRELEPDFSSGRLVDKHPLHMARMPLLYRLFPDAPIVFVERHPYDAVLSCFIANFQPNHAMRSFSDLEEAARTYDAVFSSWALAEERLPLNVHRVRYERLVENPQAELKGLLAFLGIDADPASLDHQAAAADRGHIRTASYSQVTEPIYRRSVARWRRYAAQLEPIIPILAPWADKMGYEVK